MSPLMRSAEVAEMLGINRNTLRKKLQQGQCEAVMITIVQGPERTRVDLSGTRGLEL